MLGKLVNKFKKQSLQDQQQQLSANTITDKKSSQIDLIPSSSTLTTNIISKKLTKSNFICQNSMESNQDKRVLRKSARLIRNNSNATKECKTNILNKKFNEISTIFDSGTESDDDELEQLGSMSNTSLISTQSSFNENQYFNVSCNSSTKGIEILSFSKNDEYNVLSSTSPPTLTSSPPLISEIETISCDSMDCESGIVCESIEHDDASRCADFLESSRDSFFTESKSLKDDEIMFNKIISVTPIYENDGFPIDCYSTKESDENSPSSNENNKQKITNNTNSLQLRAPIDFSALRDLNINMTPKIKIHKQEIKQNDDLLSEKAGAFRPVIKHNARQNSINTSNVEMSLKYSTQLSTESSQTVSMNPQTLVVVAQELSRTNTPSPNNSIGEKRRWVGALLESNYSSEKSNESTSLSPIASRTRGILLASTNNTSNNNSLQTNLQEISRAVLTARRTKVRVLYHEQHNQTKKNQSSTLKNLKQKNFNILKNGGESPPSASCLANKRGRLTAQIHPFIKAGNGERPSLNFDKMRKRMMGFTISSAVNK